jgi:hypothetical protein
MRISAGMSMLHRVYCKTFWDSATRFSTSGFLHGSVSPKPLIIPLGTFLIFSKIHEDIHSSRCPTGSLTPVANGKNLQSEKFSLFLLDTFE